MTRLMRPDVEVQNEMAWRDTTKIRAQPSQVDGQNQTTTKEYSIKTQMLVLPPNPALKAIGVDFFDLTLFDERGVARLPPTEGNIIAALQDRAYLKKQFIAPYFRIDRHQDLVVDLYVKMGLDKLMRLIHLNQLSPQQRETVNTLMMQALQEELPPKATQVLFDLIPKYQQYQGHVAKLTSGSAAIDVRDSQSLQVYFQSLKHLQYQYFGNLAMPIFAQESSMILDQINKNNQIFDAFQQFLIDRQIRISEFQNLR